MVGTPGNRSNLHQFLGVWKAVFPMATTDFFRARLDAMIDLRHPLAVLAARMPWSQIESNLAPVFEHRDRAGRVVVGSDLYGPTMTVAGAPEFDTSPPFFRHFEGLGLYESKTYECLP